jgi:hypothetical protein
MSLDKVNKYLKPGAIIPVDIETTILLANALRQALAQTKQKPVAWVYNGILHEFDPSEFATTEVKPLYTTPPKREWVGLTEADIYEAMDFDDEFEFARDLEAKLKRKNNG